MKSELFPSLEGLQSRPLPSPVASCRTPLLSPIARCTLVTLGSCCSASLRVCSEPSRGHHLAQSKGLSPPLGAGGLVSSASSPPCPHLLLLFPLALCSSHTGLPAVLQTHQARPHFRAFVLAVPSARSRLAHILTWILLPVTQVSDSVSPAQRGPP